MTPTTPDAIPHQPECPNPTAVHRFIDQRGDTVHQCRACGAQCRTPATPAPTAAPRKDTPRTPPTPAPVAVPASSRHVCRDHGRPTTPRGTGCPECDAAKRDRRAGTVGAPR